ncbi:expressed unknown protein [Seminavis robusta]|uniref:Uncharacterized protein n=1 Tax=Seminavis robusta TaxID=568900 RepID=A0A9N8EC76_9STRA|nr:expressed unknown protein [Seminavis robusta]|eukprot:Sro868_g213370.1 n/a (291) ;mRNA; f:36220-37092
MSVSPRLVGNCLHTLNLLNIFLYGSVIYAFGTNPQSTVFDKSWLQEGFCMPHPDVDYQTTHDLSGHVMVVISLLGLALQRCLSHRQASKSTTATESTLSKADTLTFWALIGALGHAWGHYFLAFSHREQFFPPSEESFMDDLLRSSLPEAIGKACPGLPFFWMPLVQTYMINTAKGRVAIVAFFCWFFSLLMQVRFGFSYAQSVLFAGMSVDQLLLPDSEKGFEYALWPLITTVPSGIFAWLESTSCSSNSMMQQHGHLIYDVYMASSYILFYLICWTRANYSVVKTKTV